MKLITIGGSNTHRQMLVDNEDYERLSMFPWCLTSAGYPMTRQLGYAHRTILGLHRGDGVIVDHRNGNKLDNRKSNLRLCSRAENNMNSPRKSGTGYRGVYRHRKRFGVRIQLDGRSFYLGLFQDAEDAAMCYNGAAVELHGDFALLN